MKTRLLSAASAILINLTSLTASAVTIDFGNIQYPGSAIINGYTVSIYGQVYVAGMTNSLPVPYSGVTAELGYGPYQTDPSVNINWNWVTASPNLDFNFLQDNDEYVAELAIFQTGTFSYAYRYSGDDGTSWTIGDLDGSTNGIQLDELGTVIVNTPSAIPIPPAIWLFGSGLLGLVGIARSKNA